MASSHTSHARGDRRVFRTACAVRWGFSRWFVPSMMLCGLAMIPDANRQLLADLPSVPWPEAVQTARAQWARAENNPPADASELARIQEAFARDYPIPFDWMHQDSGGEIGQWFAVNRPQDFESRLLTRVLGELGEHARPLRDARQKWLQTASPRDDEAWLHLYAQACEQRRLGRLKGLNRQSPKIIFTKHHTLGGSHYAYTEAQSDAQDERHFKPGAALCLLDLSQQPARVTTLIDDPQGMIRDPDVSWDGQRILFSWKKSDREDDFHLYEYDLASGRTRQLTSGLGYADYEGVYLPDGGIIFNSTRCVQTVDCWWTEVSNLYTCDSEGRFLRRLTFDQVHDNYPTVLPDGRILYTRWEYSDRGQIYVQGLFQMNPDGTGQSEFYGNNSWFPTSLLHARGIPGTQKVLAVFSGHHTLQTGKLGIVDPALGRQENSGANLVAPPRTTEAVRVDYYGQDGELFQYPYPLNETEFLVAYSALGWAAKQPRFAVYWMRPDGGRELLAVDADISCSQPIPLAARKPPLPRPSMVDYRKTNGTCYVQNIYSGPGLAGVPPGVVKSLRVIALDYRAAGIGWNYNVGPAGEALVCTPVAIGNGSWDAKSILGEAKVYEDGSAFFTVPARTPIYFQAIDQRGYAVQTMRSWTTSQPAENVACVGCHESKNSAPTASQGLTQALRKGPQELSPFHGPPRGFSFLKEIQPILDRHCVRCHPGPDSYLSLADKPITEALAKRSWNQAYLTLVAAHEATLENNRYLAGSPGELIHWISPQSEPNLLPAYSGGASRSRLMTLLSDQHYGVELEPPDRARLAAWLDLLVPFCGDYQEANAWTPEEIARYNHFLEKRRTMEVIERANIQAFIGSSTNNSPIP